QKALSIYEQLWSDEPQLIEAKQEEILQQYVAAGLGIGSSFLI
ncbi:tetratricopeptide repeat protein, partial [bacterium 1xD8-6]